MTFYKAVQQNSTDAQATPDAKPATDAKAVKPGDLISGRVVREPAAARDDDRRSRRRPKLRAPRRSPGREPSWCRLPRSRGEDDAVALAGALRKKNYNVFVVNNPITNDKLYHVQVGPFANIQEAQAMKAKLVAEGYNPIIKR